MDAPIILTADEWIVRQLLHREITNFANIQHTGLQIQDAEWARQARKDALEFILLACETNGFQNRTAYVAVTYLDRVLATLEYHGLYCWPLMLLPRACFELASEVEESIWPLLPIIPRLIFMLQFHSRITQKVENCLLSRLEWSILPVTPFDFLHYFASIFSGNSPPIISVSEISDVVLAAVTDKNLIRYKPSVIGAAATAITLVSRGHGLNREALEPRLNASPLSQFLDTEQVWTCYDHFRQHLGMVAPVPSPLQNRNDMQAASSSGAAPGTRKRLPFD